MNSVVNVYPTEYEIRSTQRGRERVILAIKNNKDVYTIAEGQVAETIGNAIAAAILILAFAAGVAIIGSALRRV
jgi:hypothetical protein